MPPRSRTSSPWMKTDPEGCRCRFEKMHQKCIRGDRCADASCVQFLKSCTRSIAKGMSGSNVNMHKRDRYIDSRELGTSPSWKWLEGYAWPFWQTGVETPPVKSVAVTLVHRVKNGTRRVHGSVIVKLCIEWYPKQPRAAY